MARPTMSWQCIIRYLAEQYALIRTKKRVDCRFMWKHKKVWQGRGSEPDRAETRRIYYSRYLPTISVSNLLTAIFDMEKNSLADRFIVPPYSVIDARKGSWKERKKVWQSEIGSVANSGKNHCMNPFASVCLIYMYQLTNTASNSAYLSKDYVQRYVDKEVLEKEMQKMPFYGVSCFDPVLAEVIYHWFTPGSNSKIFDCFAVI